MFSPSHMHKSETVIDLVNTLISDELDMGVDTGVMRFS